MTTLATVVATEVSDVVKPTWVDKRRNSGYHAPVSLANKFRDKDSWGRTGDTLALWTDCGRASGA